MLNSHRSSVSGGNSTLTASSPYTTGRRTSVLRSGGKRKSSICSPSSASSLIRQPGLAGAKSDKICTTVRQALAPLVASQEGESEGGYLTVVDTSCAQLQYRLLGSKRYWYRSIKQEKQGGDKRWEVLLYKPWCRKSTLESMSIHNYRWDSLCQLPQKDVQLQHIGFFDSEKAAIQAYDAAFQARDAMNPFTGDSIYKHELPVKLIRYFNVVIVSEVFHRKSQTERLRMVYELLLAAFAKERDNDDNNNGENVDVASTDFHVRGFSWWGPNVRKLRLWRYLTAHFIVCAKTPAQWKPGGSRGGKPAPLFHSDTERFGWSHLQNDRALNVNTALLPVSRGLAQLVAPLPTNQDITTNVLPHFYHGLPDELKRMIAEEQAKQNPATTSKQYQKLAKNSEGTFVKKYLKRNREYLQITIKLQLQYRKNMQRKTLRDIFLRERGVLTLQRLFRGYQTRKFVKRYFIVVTCAALLIQSVYRSYVSRRQTKAMRKRMEGAALNIERVFRGFKARKYAQWARQMQASAIVMERVVRGFMARRRAQRIRRAKYKQQVVLPACTTIQRVFRGYLERKIVKEKRLARQRLEIFDPAAVTIGRLLRGYIARKIAKRYQRANTAATRIQRCWWSYQYGRKWLELMATRRLNTMASRIGALGRGYIARKFVQREKRKRYFQQVILPAVANIQRIYRGYIVRKKLEDVRDRIEAAITLQQMWRSRSKIKTIQAKLCGFRIAIRNANAAKIQRFYRCSVARKELEFRRLSHQARYGKAALAIQSAWRSHCSREQLKEFRLCSIIEKTATALTQWKDNREMIEFDMADARADLKRLVKYKAKTLRRIKELKEMRIEWERRQPIVNQELAQLTEEDLDHGWGEAFETEKHILHFSLELSIEDILAKKQQVREYEAEIEDLRLELEDLERDLEECVIGETIELETYRDFEVHRAQRMFADEKARRISVQRIRWRVRDVRKNIILRERQDLQLIEKELLAKRQVQELGVLSFEKKQYMQLRLEKAIEQAAQAKAHQIHAIMEMKRDANILAGFDDVIERMGAISNEASFNFRLPKTDLRENPGSAMCMNCGRVTCDCHSSTDSSSTSNGMAGEYNSKAQISTDRITHTRNRGNRLAKRWRYQD